MKQVTAFEPDLAPYAEYALNGNGKHLRPALVALSAGALGKPTDSHVTVAVIIEMVHLATLVHDDASGLAEKLQDEIDELPQTAGVWLI